MVAAVLAATACGGSSPVAARTPTSVASTGPIASPSAAGSPSSSPSAMPATVSCGARPTGGPMFLVGGLLYDVTDPVHPRRLCAVANTSAHIWTGDTLAYLKSDSQSSTSIVLHSIGSGNESVAGQIPYPGLASPGPFATTWWSASGPAAATTILPGPPSTAGQARVWVDAAGFSGELSTYPYPSPNCMCRFGVPPPILSMSPDHQFLVAGWPNGKGSSGTAVYRLSDRSVVTTFYDTVSLALWDRTGHRLFISGSGGPASWTPEGGQVALSGAQEWSFLPGLSPDGTQVAYTAYLTPGDTKSLRVFVYDMKTSKTAMLRDALRSQVVFVKPGWVWYLEETQCDASDTTCGSWHTKPTGKVMAMNLADGVERQVNFLYAEDTTYLVPGEFWPSS